MTSRRTFFRTAGAVAVGAAAVSRPALASLPEIATQPSPKTQPPLGPVINRARGLPTAVEDDVQARGGGMPRRYALRDDQWARIEQLLPGRAGQPGVTAKDNRLFVDAVLYRYRAGIPWRDLPARFGDFRVVHLRHTRWSRTGVWQRVFEALAGDADNEYAMIDSSIVRAHQHSAGAQKGGRTRPRIKRSGAAEAG